MSGLERLIPARFTFKRSLTSVSGPGSRVSIVWSGYLFLLSAAVFLSTAACESEQEPVFMSGASVMDITAPLGTFLVGEWDPAPAAHINDPMNVRVLALDDGETTIVFAVCDLVSIPQELGDRAKQLIAEQSNLPASNVVITGTHTHSGGTPSSGGGDELNTYQQFLANRIADAVQIAINNLEPAVIGWGSGSESSQVFNRRWFVDSEDIRRNPFGGVDKVRMNPPAASTDLIEPAGPIDPEIAFISVQSKDGRPIALLANYSLHYVGGTPPATISADYFGVFADRIQNLTGADRQHPPFVGILSNGTSGNINNNNYAVSREPSEPYERMHEVADLLAAEVHRAYLDVEYHDWVKLDRRYEEITLNRREITDEMIAYAHEIMDKPGDAGQWHRREVNYANRVIGLSETPETWSVPLQAFRIGELGIAAIPAEVFVEIGLEIKERSPFSQAFTLSLANGSLGYLPTVEHHELGGYETWAGTNRLEKKAAPKIVDTLMRFFSEME